MKHTRDLSVSVARKMVERFLDEKRMSIEQLATSLNVSTNKLKNVFSPKASLGSISAIHLPLIRLYCSTKW